MNETIDQDASIHIRCDVCGRQDETVRFVAYPYVFSILVITYQRVFSGYWCRLHRIQRWLVASLITSIFGWLGIPFGILITPVRLLQLARGGLQDSNLNGRILRLIGEEKYRAGDMAGAIRCLEASLLYIDETEVSEKLRILYRSQSQSSEVFSPDLVRLFAFSTIPVIVSILGILIGVIDLFVRWAASSLFSEFPIFLVILLQAPFVILVYFCVVLFSYAFRVVIRSSRTSSVLFLYVAGIITSLLFINGIVSGGTYGIYISYYMNGFRELATEALVTVLAILTRGSFYIFSPASMSSNFEANSLFAVLLILSFVFSLLVLIPSFRSYSAQQIRILNVRNSNSQPEQSFLLTGWMGLLGVVLVFAFLFVATPQVSSIDALEAFDHISQAITHAKSGEFTQAIDEYGIAIKLKPDFPLGYMGLGYAYYYSGNLPQAQENFEEALKLTPRSLEAQNGLGWINLQNGNYELAERKFQEGLQINPQSIDSHLGLGWVYLNQLKINDSRQQFEAVLVIAPDSAEAYFGLGNLYFVINDYENAVASWNKTVNLNPKYIAAYSYIGAVYFRQDKYVEAEKAYQAALNIQSDYYDSLTGLGEIDISNYEFEKGLELLDKAIALDPNKVNASIDKAYALMQMGRFEEVAPVIDPLIQKDEIIGPALVIVYYQLNQTAKADNLLKDTIASAAKLQGYKQRRAYIAIASVYASLNKYPDAKRYIELAKGSSPIDLDSDSYFLLARVLSALGEYDAAKNAINQASQIGHSELSLYMTTSTLYVDQEKLNDAMQEVNAAIKFDNKSSSAHAQRAYILYLQGNIKTAIQEAQQAINLDRYNGYAYMQLAFAYHDSGKINDATVMAMEAVRLDNLDGLSHYILGVCYMDQGLNAKAIPEFEKFLNTYWDRAYVREYKLKAEEYLSQLKP